MKIKYLLLALMACFTVAGCSKADPTVQYKEYTPTYRWMDRQIYFAYSSGTNPSRNNEFQKQKVQDALTEISKISNLGEGYFTFSEVDEAVLQPIYIPGQSSNEYKSFILIWPDADFNDFVVNTLGGSVPDNNAVTVINSAFKRKFYMIIKASCFVSADACNGITQDGLRGLVARQMGSLVGMPIKEDCTSITGDQSVISNTMCAPLPNNDQWNDSNKLRWANSFNNSLETILNNINFYDEHQPTATTKHQFRPEIAR